MKMLWIMLLTVIDISQSLTIFDPNCVTPPLKCPNKNITFWLYTRKNRDKPVELKVSEPESIRSAPWVRESPIKILIHGYTGHKDFSPNTEIRPVYLDYYNLNVVSVDYNKIALEPCYLQAASNTELVGMCTAQLIDEMVNNHGFHLLDIHVIGFSLGGQTAGLIANFLKSGKLRRISALDPAMPMFATFDKTRKIDSGDAEFVDAVHTNALAKGKLERCGHIDFYANGGMDQPGCTDTENSTKSGCDHSRAPIYYAESIWTKKGFYGTRCFSLIDYLLGWCDFLSSGQKVIFGEYTPRNASGIYRFDTNSEPPFARGKND